MTDQPALLKLDQVNLAYRALPALQNITWSIKSGQQWACLGPNGAGKTSLANIISGRVTHVSGDITRSSRLRKGGIGYVLLRTTKDIV